VADLSFLQRLKERKLGQWTLAYLAGAFVVLQLLDALDEPLNLSATLQRSILVVVAFGLFVTLVLAWYHGERGRQRVSGPELIMISALLVMAGVALSLLGRDGGGAAKNLDARAVPGGDDRPSIAVLPCDNFSPNPEDAYRAQGIHEEILVQLRGISSLRSLGRTSVLQFADNPRPTQEIAEALGVEFVGECSVFKDPDQTLIRVTFQLLDATGTQQWADQFDRDLTVANIYDIQSEIAERVANSVGARLKPTDMDRISTAPTQSLRAYELYTQGRVLWWSRGPESLDQAIELFEAAIEEDSTFAKAYAALAETYAILPDLGGPSYAEMLPLAREAAETALSLDPDLPEAYTASGYVHAVFEWDWEAAERDYLRAIELDPDYGTAHQWYAEMLAQMGRWDEAQEEARRGVDLDPRSPAITAIMGWILTYTGRHREAIQWFERSHAIAPEYGPPVVGLAQTYRYMGDYPASATWYEQYAELGGVDPETFRAFLAGLSDPSRKAEAISVVRASSDHVDAARFLAALGDPDGAIGALESAFEEHKPFLPWINSMPDFDGMKGDPRFQELLRRFGFPQ
jgi:TolB-like protein